MKEGKRKEKGRKRVSSVNMSGCQRVSVSIVKAKKNGKKKAKRKKSFLKKSLFFLGHALV